jgi:uncharacterized protein
MNSEFDLDALADWLDDDQRADDCLDIHGLHGYLTALAIAAEPLSDEWLNDTLGQSLTDLPEQEAQHFADACRAVYQEISDELYSDDQVGLTFEPNLAWEDSDMQAWAIGFMEVVFALPDRYTHSSEDDLATLLLPIEVASGLFADEPDYAPLYRNEALLSQMFNNIPDILTDLYLLLHSPA